MCFDGHRYNPSDGSYHYDMDGEGIIFLAVDCLPTELPKEVELALEQVGAVLSLALFGALLGEEHPGIGILETALNLHCWSCLAGCWQLFFFSI